MKDNNAKQSQTQDICFEVRATALIPAFTAVKGFHYPPGRLHGLPKIRAPSSTTYKNSTEELSTQEQEEQKWSQQDH